MRNQCTPSVSLHLCRVHHHVLRQPDGVVRLLQLVYRSAAETLQVQQQHSAGHNHTCADGFVRTLRSNRFISGCDITHFGRVAKENLWPDFVPPQLHLYSSWVSCGGKTQRHNVLCGDDEECDVSVCWRT